jgi:hypothetical protein
MRRSCARGCRPAGDSDRRGPRPGGRDACAGVRYVLARARARGRPLPGVWPRSGCGRLMAITSIVTCCRSPYMGSLADSRPPAARWRDAGGLRAGRWTVADAARGAAHRRAAAAAGGGARRRGRAPARRRASRGACRAGASRPSRRNCWECRCAARACPRSRAATIGSASTPTGDLRPCSPLRAAGRRRPAALGRRWWQTADSQHRLVGVRAAARSSRHPAAPVLARPARSCCTTEPSRGRSGCGDHLLDAAALH